MARDLATPFLTNITSDAVNFAILADITLSGGTAFVWTGVGPVVFQGNTYSGIGSFGKMGDVVEATDVKPYGTVLTLSGIDPNLLNDCLNDIQIGAPVTVYVAVLDGNGNIIATTEAFGGTVDAPTISPGPDTLTIILNLENQLYNMQRANQRRWDAADQRLFFPNDSAFNFVEQLNDASFVWNP